MIDDRIIERYTEGWCWSLAWHVHYLAGYPIVTIGPSLSPFFGPSQSPFYWDHVMNRVGPMLLDVEGLHFKGAVVERWGDQFHEYLSFENRDEYIDTIIGRVAWNELHTEDKETAPATARKVARYMLGQLDEVFDVA